MVKRRPDGFAGAASGGRTRLMSWRACRYSTARSDWYSRVGYRRTGCSAGTLLLV